MNQSYHLNVGFISENHAYSFNLESILPNPLHIGERHEPRKGNRQIGSQKVQSSVWLYKIPTSPCDSYRSQNAHGRGQGISQNRVQISALPVTICVAPASWCYISNRCNHSVFSYVIIEIMNTKLSMGSENCIHTMP